SASEAAPNTVISAANAEGARTSKSAASKAAEIRFMRRPARDMNGISRRQWDANGFRRGEGRLGRTASHNHQAQAHQHHDDAGRRGYPERVISLGVDLQRSQPHHRLGLGETEMAEEQAEDAGDNQHGA